MNKIGCISFLCVCCVLAGSLFAQDWEDAYVQPFTNRTNSPIRIGVHDPMPINAIALGKGRFRLLTGFDYGSTFFSARDGASVYVSDGEIARVNGVLTYGATERLDVGAEWSLISWSGGFLDDFLLDYHNFFGLPSARKASSPVNDLQNRLVDSSGREIWRGDDKGIKGSDFSLWTRYHLLQHELSAKSSIDLAVRGGIKLPVGADGVSSGYVDVFGGVLATFRTERAGVDLNLDLVVPTGYDLADTSEYDVQPFGKGTIALQFALTRQLFFLAQVSASTPAFSRKGGELDDLTTTTLFGTFGGKIRFEQTEFHAGISEDLNETGEADFSIVLGVTWNW